MMQDGECSEMRRGGGEGGGDVDEDEEEATKDVNDYAIVFEARLFSYDVDELLASQRPEMYLSFFW